MEEKGNLSNQCLLIGKTVRFANEDGKSRTGQIVDKVRVGLASGTNEYAQVDKYIIVCEDDSIVDVYPYFVDSIIN